MDNIYGVKLDRNGYAPSIMQEYDNCCFLTFRHSSKLDRHEIFHGAYRQKSKELGLWVLLDHEIHMSLHQKNAAWDKMLKNKAQKKAMEYYGWDVAEFIRQFGKNYSSE